MSFAERFENLRIWQDAREQVSTVYQSVKRGTAGYLDRGFREQLQRVSVMNNILACEVA